MRFRQDFPGLLQNAPTFNFPSRLQYGLRYTSRRNAVRSSFRSPQGVKQSKVFALRALNLLGLAIALPEGGLNSDILTSAIASAVNEAHWPKHNLDLNGAQQTAALLRRML